MATFLTKELLEPAIRRIQQDDTLTIKEIKLSKPDLAGTHFATGVETAEILMSSPKSNSDRIIHIFIKRPSKSEAHKNLLEHLNIFQKEADAYNNILPELVNFSSSKGVKLEDFIPVCYFASGEGDSSSIILEDLSVQDYKMFPLSSTMHQDVDHATLALTALAKLHAASYCMKKSINISEKFQPSLNEIMFHDSPDSFLFIFMKPMFQISMSLFDSTSKIGKDMKKFDQRGFQHLIKLVQPKEPFNVISHGDCWSNNMLFKYDDNGKPINVKLVDWQITRYSSLAVELNYFLNTSTNIEFRKNHLQDLLKLYYKEFTETVGKLGGEMKFTFEELCAEYKSKGLFGYMLTSATVSVGLQSKGDHSDPDDVIGDELMDGFEGATQKVMADKVKRETMINILTDLHAEFEELLDEL